MPATHARLGAAALLALLVAGCAASPGRPAPVHADGRSPRLLEGLLAGPLPSLEGRLAELAAEASHAFTRADFGAARRLALEALRAAPADQAGCDGRGPLGYLAWKASRLGGGDAEEALAELRSACLALELPEGKRELQTFLGLL
ncbi:MAG TPA: hypothetical protein P5076_23375, partial [Myxococcota bacterium]|nr:hypothetical protein [Myxococcota bacterium]